LNRRGGTATAVHRRGAKAQRRPRGQFTTKTPRHKKSLGTADGADGAEKQRQFTAEAQRTPEEPGVGRAFPCPPGCPPQEGLPAPWERGRLACTLAAPACGHTLARRRLSVIVRSKRRAARAAWAGNGAYGP